MMIRLLLWDRFPLIVQGLSQLLSREPDIEIVGRASTIDEAKLALRTARPDILIHGTAARGDEALAGVRALRDGGDLAGSVRVILFAEALPERTVIDALRLDIRGMVLKEMPSELMLTCIRKVSAGERWLERDSHLATLDMLIAERHGMAHSGVTARELEVLRFLGGGLSNKAIAERMSVSEGTIKALIQRLFSKLDAENRVGLVMAATERNLI